MVRKKRSSVGGKMRDWWRNKEKRTQGGDEDIDQSTGQGQPHAPRGPISLHTYEHFYRDPYKWCGLNLT